MEEMPEEEKAQEVVQDADDEEDESPDNTEKKASPPLVINFYSWATPIVGVVMLLLGLVGGYFVRPLIQPAPTAAPNPEAASLQSMQTETPQPTMDPETRKQLMDYLLPQVKHFKGDANAPITIIEFSDFQCPYCGRYATQVGPQIDEQYINDGKVRMGYWHVAFLGEESQWAAEAAECAADQDAFWEYHDKLFNSQNGE